MKKFLKIFLKFGLFSFYIIDVCIMLIYPALMFIRYGLIAGLSMLLFHPAMITFSILLFAIFIAGTILICKSKKNHLQTNQHLSIEKISNKYKTIKCFIIILITLFYIVGISVTLFLSYCLFEEIKTMNNSNPLPSSLNMGIESMILYWIICIISLVVVTVLIVKNNKKKR